MAVRSVLCHFRRVAADAAASERAEAVQAGLTRVAGLPASTKGADGRFTHDPKEFPEWVDHGLRGFLRWRRTVEPRPALPPPAELNAAVPVLEVCRSALETPPPAAMQLTWLGHASVLVQWDGWTVLADPIFSERCSALQFVGPSRYRPAPCEIRQLPKVDAVVISHSHYDHLDLNTVMELAERDSPPMWFVPLGMKGWMESAGVTNVVEMDWGQQATLVDNNISAAAAARPDLRVTCLPCQHWCARTPWDRNTVLWASWHLGTDRGSHYFGGDTGYCGGVFRKIGSAMGRADVAAIPIGAYGGPTETWFHKPSHMNPEEAVKCRDDIKAKHAVGVHWGTFQLTCEPMLEPPQRMAAARDAAGLDDEAFIVLKHGETKAFALEGSD